MLKLGDVNGYPYVGVYCVASEHLALLPEAIEGKTAKEIERTLDVRVIRTNIAGATVVGSLAAMNSSGIVVTNFAEKGDLARLPKQLRVGKMEEKIKCRWFQSRPLPTGG